MKNLYTREEFLNAKIDYQQINEGFFGFLGKMFNKAKAYLNKVKGAKEVDAIYNKYIKIIEDQFKQKADIDLNLKAEEQIQQNKPVEGNQANQNQNTSTPQKNESRIYEADEQQANQPNQPNQTNQQSNQPNQTNQQPNQPNQQPKQENKPAENKNVKLDAATLKKKQNVLQQILTLYKNKAIAEMNRVLTKLGGGTKNPQLASIIDAKKEEFNLAYLNAEIKYYETAGDKGAANKLVAERNKLAKGINDKWNNIDKVKFHEIEVNGKKFKTGTLYRFKNDKGEVKTIKIDKESNEDGNIMASYTFGDTKDKIQNFTADNIELDFTPEKGKEYIYHSIKNPGNVLRVKVNSEPNEEGKVNVTTVGGKKTTTFMLDKGALLDVQEQPQQK